MDRFNRSGKAKQVNAMVVTPYTGKIETNNEITILRANALGESPCLNSCFNLYHKEEKNAM